MPLSRFTVLDLTRVRAGPTAVRQFADWGAKVIKIEMPPGLDEGEGMGGPRHGFDFQNLHRNKRAITLNLKEPEGVAVLKKLVAKADVIVENYRPDVKTRLGIDYDALSKVNPGLVYVSISGFGQDGPYAKRAGFDQVAQGMGGIMSVTGEPGQGPMRAGIAIADMSAGVFAALGAMIALLERENSGKGQWVQSSLLGAQIAMCDFQAARWTLGKEVPPQAGNNHPTSIPTGVFKTKDGHINIAASGGAIYKRFCDVLQAPDLMAPPYDTSASRSKNRDTLNAKIAAHIAKRSSKEWVELLNEAGVPSGPIYKMDEMFADPQVKHLGIATKVTHPKLGEQEVIGQAVKLSRTPSKIKTATPELGEHTDEVLKEFGYGAAEIADMRKRKVV
jgi:crotonobetainyl-CoA:carnitine CoA-transferase CaiB-like acyl-CoA transferase